MRGVFITATDTGVGKTTLARLLIPALISHGIALRVRKPVESGCAMVNGRAYPADAGALAESFGDAPSPRLSDICPYALHAVASSARAAQMEARSINLDMLVAACVDDMGDSSDMGAGDEFLLVEGAGGICSPLCADALNIDLACKLRLPLIIVTEDKLGCISQTLAALNVATTYERRVIAVVLNQIPPSPKPPQLKDPEDPEDPSDMPDASNDTDNLTELRQWTNVPVVRMGHHRHGVTQDAAMVAQLAAWLIKASHG